MKELFEKLLIADNWAELSKKDRDTISDLSHDEKLPTKERKKYFKLILKQEDERPKKPDFTEEEKGFRRGYLMGFVWSRISKVEYEKVRDWAQGCEETCPPGTPYEGMKLPGLTKKSDFSDFMKD